jgi:glutamyl/glutaminyl-tRNA synthetase
LANVVDDHLMGITHVIRGEDWIPSCPKHIMLYNALSWEHPVFAHVPNVLGENGKKLSKRTNAKSVLDFKKEGYLSEALLNYLMLLGFSPKDNREILSKEEIIKEFSLDKVNSAPSVFDEKKLLWMNGEYIRKSQNLNLKNQILEFFPELKNTDQDLLEKFIEVAKSRMKTLADFKLLVSPFLDNQTTPSSEIKDKFRELLENVSSWEKDKLIERIKELNREYGYGFQEIYRAVIGAKSGLPLADVFEILGKEKTLLLLK